MGQLKKRTKRSRYRGHHSHGWGFKKKNRGKGHKGGKGMAGTGKRASQKEQYGQRVAKAAGFDHYFGGSGYTSRSVFKPKRDQINLDDILRNFNSQVAAGKEINLENHKILGEGEGFKGTIKAKFASKSAIEKMEKAGGKIIVTVRKERKDKPKVIVRDEKTGKVKKSDKPVEKKEEAKAEKPKKEKPAKEEKAKK